VISAPMPGLRLLFVAVAAWCGGCAAAVDTSGPAAAATWRGELKGMLILNEDNSHFFGSRPPEAMTAAGLNAFIDPYAGSAVTHLFLSPNSMRASFRSRTREAIWDPVEGVEPDHLWPKNARRLHDAGLDPYSVWIQRARAKGISPWLSKRPAHGMMPLCSAAVCFSRAARSMICSAEPCQYTMRSRFHV